MKKHCKNCKAYKFKTTNKKGIPLKNKIRWCLHFGKKASTAVGNCKQFRVKEKINGILSSLL
jgi:hypothetical protein